MHRGWAILLIRATQRALRIHAVAFHSCITLPSWQCTCLNGIPGDGWTNSTIEPTLTLLLTRGISEFHNSSDSHSDCRASLTKHPASV